MAEQLLSEALIGVPTSLHEKFKKAFEEIKNTTTTRIVYVLYESCCGCGCADIDLIRTVDSSSTLQTGDRVSNIEENDYFPDDPNFDDYYE